MKRLLVFITSLTMLHAAEEIAPAPPLPGSTIPYVCQFIFTAFDDDRNPLDIELSRTALKTARIIETEYPVHAELVCPGLTTDKGFRVLLEDFDYVKQTWVGLPEYHKYFQNHQTPFEEISKKLQTIWLFIDGKEVQCSWDYHVRGIGAQPVSFFRPDRTNINWGQSAYLSFGYKILHLVYILLAHISYQK